VIEVVAAALGDTRGGLGRGRLGISVGFPAKFLVSLVCVSLLREIAKMFLPDHLQSEIPESIIVGSPVSFLNGVAVNQALVRGLLRVGKGERKSVSSLDDE
jgi:hypothetical protein